jgi:putative ABC transport system substrate-binding protein
MIRSLSAMPLPVAIYNSVRQSASTVVRLHQISKESTMRGSTVALVVLLALSLLCVPLTAAEAPQATKVFRIGLLSTVRPRFEFADFSQYLQERGYVEGQNLVIEFRNAEGQAERLPDLAAELVRLHVDVIVVSGPEATLRAARHATSTIPIVMVALNYDPVARGYIDGLARPGGNITGVFAMQLELTGKRLELLKEALPQLTRVSALWDAHTADQLRATEAAAQSLGLELQAVELRQPPYNFADAIGIAVQQRAQALVILSSPLFLPQRTQIAEVARQHRLPTMYQAGLFVEAGGLMAYGVSLPAMWRHATGYVDRILKGAKPADLPVEQPTKFELVINLKTAQALGITIPPTFLALADEVLQ